MYSFHESAITTIKHSLPGILTLNSEPAVYIKGNTEPIKAETVDNLEESFHCCGPDRRQALSRFPMPYPPHSLTLSGPEGDPDQFGRGPAWEVSGRPSAPNCIPFSPVCPSPHTPCSGRRWYCQHPLCPSPLTPGRIWPTAPHPRRYKTGTRTTDFSAGGLTTEMQS